jgi:hypothetical protein
MPVSFVAFDGDMVTAKPYRERRALLEGLGFEGDARPAARRRPRSCAARR